MPGGRGVGARVLLVELVGEDEDVVDSVAGVGGKVSDDEGRREGGRRRTRWRALRMGSLLLSPASVAVRGGSSASASGGARKPKGETHHLDSHRRAQRYRGRNGQEDNDDAPQPYIAHGASIPALSLGAPDPTQLDSDLPSRDFESTNTCLENTLPVPVPHPPLGLARSVPATLRARCRIPCASRTKVRPRALSSPEPEDPRLMAT